MKKKKRKYITIILVSLLLVGLFLLLYPSVSNYINSLHQTKAISTYKEQISSMSDEDREYYLNEAYEYNQRIHLRANTYAPTDEERRQYDNILNLSGDGVMGYVVIPAIDVSLPVYHGTSERVLQNAVGHLDWTSFPVGGPGSHCVLSGHRGLPSAKLFTSLDQVAVNDVFMLCRMDEILTYKVDQILIVDPQDTAALEITEGADYCTLLTCTPYGINTQRLLVRGHRIETAKEDAVVQITSEAVQIEPLIVTSAIAVPLLLILVVTVFTVSWVKDKKSGESLGGEQK
ncbi:MAG: class C sortase [Clostridia bacterium]|nr:class C sortase [Clostridia bacterium]